MRTKDGKKGSEWKWYEKNHLDFQAKKRQQQKTINIFGVGGSSGARLDNNTSQHNNKAALQKAQGKKKNSRKVWAKDFISIQV